MPTLFYPIAKEIPIGLAEVNFYIFNNNKQHYSTIANNDKI